MVIFLIFYTVYGIGHLYLFLKLKSTFLFNSTEVTILVAFLLFMMTLSPFFVHLYSVRGPANRVRTFAYIGYMWLAGLLIFCTVAVPIDVYNLSVRTGGLLLQKDLDRIMIPSLKAFLIPLIHSIALTTYGYFKAKTLPVERLTVETSKLPEGVNRLKVAHVSDLHLGMINREERLNKVLKVIESEMPDLIVSTGDLLDAEVNHIDYLTERLGRVSARLGKFAVTGNHEFYGGIKHSIEFLKGAGFTVLRGEGVKVENVINIAGVDDPTGRHSKLLGSGIYRPEKEILSKLPSRVFTLLLKHRPSIDKSAIGLFDLQLSGHAHKGQIFPIGIVTRLIYHTHAGYSRLSNGSAIYVSRGAGTAGPPIRFMSPPEVTIIEIVSTKEMKNVKIKNQN